MMFNSGKRLKYWNINPIRSLRRFGEIFIGHVPGTGTADINVSGCWRVKAPHQVQERRLPGTRRSHYRDELTPLNREVDTIKRGNIA